MDVADFLTGLAGTGKLTREQRQHAFPVLAIAEVGDIPDGEGPEFCVSAVDARMC